MIRLSLIIPILFAVATAVEGQSYCPANANNFTYEWIQSVVVGNLQNNSAGSKYSDFTSLSANLTKGATVNYSLTPGFSSSTYTEQWRVFIDFNQNGKFDDPGEMVVSQQSNTTVSGSFTVPEDALTGQTRMRVLMKWGSPPSPCETTTFSYGEVEDYTVLISEGSGSPEDPKQIDVDEIGFNTSNNFMTSNNPPSHMLAATVVQDPAYGLTFRHYTYSYDSDQGNDGRTQMYISKSFPLDSNISSVRVVDVATNLVVFEQDCYPSSIDIHCSAYISVLLGLEQRVTKTYSIRYFTPQDKNSEKYEYRFKLASAKLKRTG